MIIIIIEIILVILIGIYSVSTWYFFGKDPKRKTIIPEFSEPENISSMFVAYINGERDSKEILKIGLLSLLLKNYIFLDDKNNEENKIYVLNQKNKDNLKLRSETLFEEENNLLDILSENNLFENKLEIIGYKNRIIHFFEKKYNRMIYKNNYLYFIPFILGTAISIVFTLSELMHINIANSIIITTFIFIWLKYVFGMSGRILKFLYITVTVGGIIGIILYTDIFYGLILLILGAMFFIYRKVIGKYTFSGKRKLEYIEGLKMYFKTAEKNKMDEFETEEEKLNYFNQIFPYIVALKVENEKMGIFKDSLDFLNIMGSYAEAKYYVNEYVDTKFPIFRKKRIFW